MTFPSVLMWSETQYRPRFKHGFSYSIYYADNCYAKHDSNTLLSLLGDFSTAVVERSWFFL